MEWDCESSRSQCKMTIINWIIGEKDFLWERGSYYRLSQGVVSWLGAILSICEGHAIQCHNLLPVI